MRSLAEITFLIGPIALLLALIAVPIYYVVYLLTPEPKAYLGLLRYLLITLGAGALAFIAGIFLGILVACSGTNASNLCGLTGIFGVGPLAAAITIIVCAHFSAIQVRTGGDREQ